MKEWAGHEPELSALRAHARSVQTVDDFQGFCCEASKILYACGRDVGCKRR